MAGEERNKVWKRKNKTWPIYEAAPGRSFDGELRSATGHRPLCCTCTCSRGQWAWPEGGRGRPPARAGQSQQRSPRPAETHQDKSMSKYNTRHVRVGFGYTWRAPSWSLPMKCNTASWPTDGAQYPRKNVLSSDIFGFSSESTIQGIFYNQQYIN